jgi:hypothetical protein
MRLLDPAGLGRTFAESDEEIPGGLQVRGYSEESEDITDVCHPSSVSSAGAMVSTTGDITRFAHALFDGGLLEPETVAEMVTPPPGSPALYGLGVVHWDTDVGPMYHHSGLFTGFSSLYTYFADHRASYAIFANEWGAGVWSVSDPIWPLVFPTTSALAAVAQQPGAAGTSWVSDAVLFNPNDDMAYVELRYHREGRDNSGAEGTAFRLGPRSSVLLDDLVETTFESGGSSGAVVVISSAALEITSRTYNDDDTGTFGQFIPAVPEERWISGVDPAVLLQLTGTDRYRSNIGFANLGPEHLEVTVELFAADAGAIETLTATLPPYSYDQLNGVFAGKAVVEDGYAVVRAASEEARYLAYASVVDNATGDPIFIAPVEAGSEVVYVPAAAHVDGIGGTSWRTDLELFSAGAEEATYRVEWLPESEANTDPAAETFTLEVGRCVRYGDVVEEVFDASGAGAIRVTVDAGEVMVTSRTYNDLGERTYGQLIPGLTLTDAVAAGERARIVGLAHSTDPEQGFRTNIGLVNASAAQITVLVFLYDSDHNLLGSETHTLEPFAYVQDTNVFAEVTDQDLSGGIVEAFAPAGPYFAWASVVDNRSGDPVFIPAQPPARE